MCLIIHRSEANGFTRPLPVDVIEHNKTSNPDGFGIAWRVNGELRYDKYGPDQFDTFEAALKLIDGCDYEYTAHFRKATHGAPSQELSHPFEYVDPDAGLVLVFHNGVLKIKTEKGESDTDVFVKYVLSKLPAKWWANPAYVWLVEDFIYPSRMLLMTAAETVILNEESWQSIDGFDYSVTPVPKIKPVTTTSKPATTWQTQTNAASCGVPSKSASESAQILLPETTGTTSTTIPLAGQGELVIPESTGSISIPRVYRHRNHFVSLVHMEDRDASGDEWGQAWCQTCEAFGYYWIIDGKSNFEMEHTRKGQSKKEAVQAALAVAQQSIVESAGGTKPAQQIGFVPPPAAQLAAQAEIIQPTVRRVN